MSKPTRDTQLRHGEQVLKEWGIAPDADIDALRSVSGRDAAADLAIAARLGARGESSGIPALVALEASSDKLVRREVRRSLYRLDQRGVDIPHSDKPPPPTLAPAAQVEGFVSPVDGRGDQLVWLVKARPGGLAHLFAVLNDPDGLREVDLSETTRKALRAARQELLNRHELRMVAADWRYCDFLINRAVRWANAANRTVSGDYRGLRAQLIHEPVAEMPPLIFTLLDTDAVQREPHLVAESAQLLEEGELRTWFFDPETLQPYLDEMRQIKDSPLVLNPLQQQERFRAVTERAIEELFGGAMQASWVRRLQEMAYFFHATGRVEQAKRALAASVALATSSRGGREITICEQLVRASLAAFWQVEEQREQEEARGSLVVTPQQAARELERRR